MIPQSVADIVTEWYMDKIRDSQYQKNGYMQLIEKVYAQGVKDCAGSISEHPNMPDAVREQIVEPTVARLTGTEEANGS